MRFCPTCGLRVEAGYCPEDGTATELLADDSEADSILGQVIDGRYRIERQIGEGGMGVVYLASHTVLSKKLALKVLRGEMARDADTVQRFIQEAQAASAIGHQNIIDINDFGRLPDGSAYFVMEYLQGSGLTELINRGGSVPMHEAMAILIQIASALGAAHKQGIVHRDLKPDNIFLVRRGEMEHFVKVLDFGIAKVASAGAKLTKTGMVFGTPQYMSPEQAAGQAVDHRTDIYALGVIMYEMFTGHVPFDADTFMGILSKHMFEPPVPPSVANPQLGALEDVILKCLAKKPEERYPEIEGLRLELKAFSSTDSVPIGSGVKSARPSALADALEPPSRTEVHLLPDGVRSGRWPMLVGGLVLFLIGSAALGTAAYVLGAGDGRQAEVEVPTMPTPAANADPTRPSVEEDLAQAQLPGASDESVQQRVRLTTRPGSAQVLEDDIFLGSTPIEVDVAAGPRELLIRLSGYRQTKVRVSTGSGAEVSVALRRERPTANRTRPDVTEAALQPATPESATPASMDAPASSVPTVPESELVNPWAR